VPLIERYLHRTGEHCASTALRNILADRGSELSEGMIFGLASGAGFLYIEDDDLSPTRMFHGRTATLEGDFAENTGVDYVERAESDDEIAWQNLRRRIDAGEPVMLSTDTFYLGYHTTTSHFPGHRCVAVGYDDDSETVFLADRKFDAYQRCSFEELRRSRNARDYPMSCENRYADFGSRRGLGRPIEEAIAIALERNAREMLEPPPLPFAASAGIPAMRTLAERLPSWKDAPDWSWCARFGYQIVIKRGAAGSFFRPLEVAFLRESEAYLPELGEAKLAERMHGIAARWRDFAGLLKQQSDRESCDPDLFVRAGHICGELADAEESFFSDALALTSGLGVGS
jgi:hypothetical protein